jgi:hypothetical protein
MPPALLCMATAAFMVVLKGSLRYFLKVNDGVDKVLEKGAKSAANGQPAVPGWQVLYPSARDINHAREKCILAVKNKIRKVRSTYTKAHQVWMYVTNGTAMVGARIYAGIVSGD